MNWELSAYGLVPSLIGIFFFPLLSQASIQANSLVLWHVFVLMLGVLLIVGLSLVLMALLGQRPPSEGQAKSLWLMSFVLALVFFGGALWSGAIYSDDLACAQFPGLELTC